MNFGSGVAGTTQKSMPSIFTYFHIGVNNPSLGSMMIHGARPANSSELSCLQQPVRLVREVWSCKGFPMFSMPNQNSSLWSRCMGICALSHTGLSKLHPVAMGCNGHIWALCINVMKSSTKCTFSNLSIESHQAAVLWHSIHEYFQYPRCLLQQKLATSCEALPRSAKQMKASIFRTTQEGNVTQYRQVL